MSGDSPKSLADQLAVDLPRVAITPLSREHVAAFLKSRENEIRAVARAKLTIRTRSVNDSEDVYSSVLRRMDELAMNGEVRPRSETELWALARTIAANDAVSKTRLCERAQALVSQDGEYARTLAARLLRVGNDDEAMLLLLRLARSCESSADRQMLFLRMRGASHKVIADNLGISPDASRQRWSVLRGRLEAAVKNGVLDG